MTTDYRDLITRMAKELDDYRQLLLDDRTVTHRLSDEARAVLAHWGNPAPAPPADGEVAELVAWIRGMYWAHPDKERATRAAELLERQVLPEVSE